MTRYDSSTSSGPPSWNGGRKPPGGLLIWLSGADPATLVRAPKDIKKFTGLGGVVLTTASMAAISFAFAIRVGVRAPLPAAIVFGLLWGLAILNLDRWLVAAAQRRDRWFQNLASVIPRLVLGLVIGAVVSTPLVLWVFNREIEAHLETMHQVKLSGHQLKLENDARFKEIPALQTKVQMLRALADGTGSPAPDAEAAKRIQQLQDQYNTLDGQYKEAQRLATCEYDGTCGTMRYGDGGAYRLRQQRADELRQQRDTTKNTLDAELAKHQTATVNARQSARRELPDAEKELKRLETIKQQEEDKFREANINDDGLLARLDALSQFTARNATLRTAYIVLLLFITAIEILPVLTKFLMTLGPPTTYDVMLVDAQAADVETGKADTALKRDLRIEELRVRADQEREKIPDVVKREVDVDLEIHKRRMDQWRRTATASEEDPRGLRSGPRRTIPRSRNSEPEFTAYPPPEEEDSVYPDL